MIGAGVLSGCPSISPQTLARGLFFRGELSCAPLRLRKPVTLMVSANNPGADRVAEELADVFHGMTIKPMLENDGRRSSGRRLSWSLPSSSVASPSSEALFFVLYLNKHTFLDKVGSQLAAQLRAVQQRNPHAILLLHENDDALGGCEFGRWRCSYPWADSL